MRKTIAIGVLMAGAVYAADKEKVLAGEPLTTSRTIAYHAKDIPSVNAQLNFVTMVVFSKDEKILVGACGDADRWELEHAENVITIKPETGARGLQTNVNVIMQSGNIYSFVVHEISSTAGAQADLKIFMTPGDETMLSAVKGGKPMFVAADDLAAANKRAAEAEAKLQSEKSIEKTKIADAQNTAPQRIRHDYQYDAKRARKMGIKAFYTLNGFTYIEADSQEAPAVYEVKDGKPSLIEIPLSGGRYVAQKIIDQGYLKIGKQKLDFKREQES